MTIGSNRLQRFNEKVFRAVLDGVLWITGPPAGVEPKQHRRNRLLAAFMLIMSVNTFLGSLYMKNSGGDTWKVMLATAMVFSLGYFISRTRHYRITLGIAITAPAIPSLAFGILQLPEFSSTMELMGLTLPLMVASVMLTVRQTIPIAVIYLLLISTLGVRGLIEFGTMAQMLSFISTITFFVIVITYIRRKDQAELENQLSERARFEEILQESEEKFFKAFHASPESISINRLEDGEFIEVNDSFLRSNGFTREEIIGRSAGEVTLWANEGDQERMTRLLKEQGRISNEEFQFKVKSGEIRTVLLSAELITIGGEPCTIVVSTDITERKRAEDALADEATWRRILVEQSRDGIVILDQAGRVFEANRRFAEMLGYSQEEVMKLDVWDWEYLYPPEQVKEMIRTVTEDGDHFETRHRRKDGTIYDVEISTNAATFAGQKLIFCVCRDITERKNAEELLRFSDAAFKSIHESVIVTDVEGRVTSWNEISEQLFGIKASEAVGKKFLDIIEVVETYPGETQDRVKRIKVDGRWEDERLYRTKKGDIWVDVRLQDIVDNGKHYGRMMLASDITERKRAEEELKRALAELEQSSARLAATNKELEAFSYSVSHDLRSPLRSIDGFSQALLEDYQDKLDETGQDYLDRLRKASQKMGEIIDGLLKLSRLTRSEMRLQKVDLTALAEEIAASLQETRPERRVKFVIDKGLTAHGDPQLLRALLENLLGNAWKFTVNNPEAKIEFSLDKNGSNKAYFIRDNGAGFDMTYVDKLFGPFQRLHDATEFPGTGIGLATVQRIINRHGGTIRAEGAVGKGATFHFTLN
jgi:PAS domain S-box-containing protein